ncbi:hypothetical protein SAMN05444365_105243 [Micromonospora pattaloongensis]|uniref:Septum formation initiator n=1 Tax=Micromonospora pattaloongensis TaxID=405436 RepID=A0A1H3Q5K3_9ACTN|nr:hypothetical protein [Micromonospora pattaloongensis]SDZ08540.1 hypothetical protein SAMN05444365_105243 [Micromonospora pattaloongensis]
MTRRGLFTVAGWLAAAVAATLVGLAAVRLIGAGITGDASGELLTAEQVAEALAAASPTAAPAPATAAPPTTAASPTSAASPSPDPARAAVSTPGGTVVAACANGLVQLLSWSPASGYAGSHAEPGPERRARVRFEGAERKVDVEVVCDAGRPVASWKSDG